MAQHCSHPTCYESDETATMFKEPTCHNDKGWFPVCGQHVDLSKDGLEVLFTDESGIAEIATAAILDGLTG